MKTFRHILLALLVITTLPTTTFAIGLPAKTGAVKPVKGTLSKEFIEFLKKIMEERCCNALASYTSNEISLDELNDTCNTDLTSTSEDSMLLYMMLVSCTTNNKEDMMRSVIENFRVDNSNFHWNHVLGMLK